MKCFPEARETLPRIRSFNYKLSSTRVIVENAIARLKNKWARLKKVSVRSINRVKLIIRTCLILHNLTLKLDTVMDRPIRKRSVELPESDVALKKRDRLSRFI